MILCFGWEKHNPCSRAPSLHGLLDPEAEVTTILWKAGIYSSNDTVSYPIKLKSLSLSSSSWLWEPQISHKIPTFFYYPTHATELEFQSYPLCPHTSVWEPWTRLQTRSAGVDSWHRQYISFFSKTFRLSLGHTQPPSQWVIWGGILWGLQHLGHEADSSFASSAQVKNDRSYTSTPLLWHAHGLHFFM